MTPEAKTKVARRPEEASTPLPRSLFSLQDDPKRKNALWGEERKKEVPRARKERKRKDSAQEKDKVELRVTGLEREGREKKDPVRYKTIRFVDYEVGTIMKNANYMFNFFKNYACEREVPRSER